MPGCRTNKLSSLSIIGLCLVFTIIWLGNKDKENIDVREYRSTISGSTKIVTIDPFTDHKPQDGFVEESRIASIEFRHTTDALEKVLLQSAGLQGSAIDGRLAQDASGELIVDDALKGYFDYLLLVEDLWGMHRLKEWFALYATQKLDIEAAQQAFDIFNNYIDYLSAIENIQPPYFEQEQIAYLLVDRSHNVFIEKIKPELQTFINQRQQIRNQFLSEEVQSQFFDEEDKVLIDAINKTDDQVLYETASISEYSGNESAVRDNFRQYRFSHYQKVKQRTKHTIVNANELLDSRVALFGSDAAERLETLDQKRRQWRQRLESFKKDQAAILEFTDDPEAITLLVNDLLFASFQAHEIPRVEAILRLSGESLK